MSEDAATRRGTVTRLQDGRQRLEFRREWPDPVDDVWAAITEPDRTVRWIGTYDGERAVGGTGTFTMTHEEQPTGEPMRIVECDPPRRLVLEWSGQENWRVDLDLSVEGGRTVLRFAQVFVTTEEVPDVATGWHWYLDKFEAELTERPQPGDWDTFLAEVGPAYSAPSAS